jgi:hypothetical protein
LSTTHKPCEAVWHSKVRHDCCPAWQDFTTFSAWVKTSRDFRSLRRRNESLPYSPGNCFWANNTPRGDAFIEKVIALRESLLGESQEQAEDWFVSVSHQRRYFWFNENKGKVAS